jgi:glycosyltransferase involved in cell wall biosynthesis
MKTETPKISIISPIYNREKYILRFLRSIQNQYFDNVEIIFVDDFSSDNSVKTIENYQIEDERILLIKHNKNKGTLISRNDGALISKGEYLIFPDPDDILAQDTLNIFYQYSKVNNYEIIRYNLFDQRENDIFYNSIVSNLDSKRIEQPELFYYFKYQNEIQALSKSE